MMVESGMGAGKSIATEKVGNKKKGKRGAFPTPSNEKGENNDKPHPQQARTHKAHGFVVFRLGNHGDG